VSVRPQEHYERSRVCGYVLSDTGQVQCEALCWLPRGACQKACSVAVLLFSRVRGCTQRRIEPVVTACPGVSVRTGESSCVWRKAGSGYGRLRSWFVQSRNGAVLKMLCRCLSENLKVFDIKPLRNNSNKVACKCGRDRRGLLYQRTTGLSALQVPACLHGDIAHV